MNCKNIVEEIEKRAKGMCKYAEYDALTYKLCKSFQLFYITRLIHKRTYIKYIDRVLDVQNKIFDYYKFNRTVLEKDKDIFFSIIYK